MGERVNLTDLRYLVALADHGHFGRAAAACFVTQPTLSTQVRKLERELGVDLVERNRRGVLLTAVGEQVLAHARRAIGEADEITELARQTREPGVGRVRLGLFPTLAPYLLPHVVPRIHAEHPGLELLLVEEKTEVVVEQLRDGRLDAGLLALPVDEPGLTEVPLFDEDFVLAVPAEHVLAGGSGVVALATVAPEGLLLLEEGHCLRQQALDVCHVAGASERQGFRATSLETLRQMVAAGVGCTLLPALAVQAPAPSSPGVALRRLAAPVPGRRIALVHRTSASRSPVLADLVTLLRDLPPLDGVRSFPG